MTRVDIKINGQQAADVIVPMPQPVSPAAANVPDIGWVEISTNTIRGSIWSTGEGPPTDMTGNLPGDMYMDTVSGDIYKWDGDSWELEGTFAPSTDTPEEILAKLVTVDGAGSGLDADLLDGQHGAYYATQTSQTYQDTRLGIVEATNASQDTRLTNVENANTAQDAAIAGKEPAIATGNPSYFWAGDKTWKPVPPAGIPEAPTDGLTYGRKNAAWASVVGGAIVSDTPPASPQNGQMWFESDSGNTYIWYTDPNTSQWVQINNNGGNGAGIVDRLQSVPADISLGPRVAGSPAGSLNRWVFNNAADLSGTDTVVIDEVGYISTTASYVYNAIYSGGWLAMADGFSGWALFDRTPGTYSWIISNSATAGSTTGGLTTVMSLDRQGHISSAVGANAAAVPAASRSAITAGGDFTFTGGYSLCWNMYWDTAAANYKNYATGWSAGLSLNASAGVVTILRSTASAAAGAIPPLTGILQLDPTAGVNFPVDYLFSYGNGSNGISHQGRSTLVDFYKISGSNSFRWLKSSNGLTSGTGVTVLGSLDDAGSLTIPGVFTAASSIQTNNGNLIARASSGNAQVIYQNSAGTAVGYCYADITNQAMYLYNNFGSGANMALTSVGGLLLSGASNGYRGKAGSNGAQSVNVHNWYYNAGPIQAWVDLTNLGNITISSDYRIKKDVQPLGSMWETVKGLNPISYTQAEFDPPSAKARVLEEGADAPGPMFPADDILRYGFIAHELQEDLIPTAANGVKDAHDEVQSLNLAPVVAALTRALQEAMARIEALEAARGV